VKSLFRGSCAGVGILASSTRCHFDNAFWTFEAQCCGKDVAGEVDEDCIEDPRCVISFTSLGMACLFFTGLLVPALVFCAARGWCCCRRRAGAGAGAASPAPFLGTELSASKALPRDLAPHAPSHWGSVWHPEGCPGLGGGAGLAHQLSAAADEKREPAAQQERSKTQPSRSLALAALSAAAAHCRADESGAAARQSESILRSSKFDLSRPRETAKSVHFRVDKEASVEFFEVPTSASTLAGSDIWPAQQSQSQEAEASEKPSS